MMRLSKEERAKWIAHSRAIEANHKQGRGASLLPEESLALDLADELAAMTDAWVGAELREESLKYTVKRLKRQVELMGWLIQSHETDIEYMGAPHSYKATFDQMGDPSDDGEYTDDDLDMLKDNWPAAREELERRKMAADWPTGETMQEIDARENPR